MFTSNALLLYPNLPASLGKTPVAIIAAGGRTDVHRRPVLLFDGAGLAPFAVAGTQKALATGLNTVMAVLMGMLTGIGG